MLATLKGLPLAYNRDLQEDKEPLFDAVDQTKRALPAVMGMMATAQFDTDQMRSRADGPAAAAVDLAEWLVERGMPFRQAHAIVGLTRARLGRSVGPAGRVGPGPPASGTDALGLLEPGVAVTRRTSPGGAGPGPWPCRRSGSGTASSWTAERVSHAAVAADIVGAPGTLMANGA